jgi:hypothetical protein
MTLVCAGVVALGLGLVISVGGTFFLPHRISREAAVDRLGLTLPAETAVRAYYQAPPPPGFCMAEFRLSPDQFREFTSANRLRWRPADRTEHVVQFPERMGMELLKRMKLWQSPLPQPLLVDDQRYLVYHQKLHTRRWIHQGEEKPAEFDSTIRTDLFAHRELSGDMLVLCFRWG